MLSYIVGHDWLSNRLFFAILRYKVTHFFSRLSSLVHLVGIDMVLLTELIEESFRYSE